MYLATSHEGRADCCVSSYESLKEELTAVYLATSHEGRADCCVSSYES